MEDLVLSINRLLALSDSGPTFSDIIPHAYPKILQHEAKQHIHALSTPVYHKYVNLLNLSFAPIGVKLRFKGLTY